jgi:hypothetical protein
MFPLFVDTNGTLLGGMTDEDICGCHVPRTDYCVGVTCPGQHEICRNREDLHGFECVCEAGFRKGRDGACVDPEALMIRLRGPAVLELEQVGHPSVPS